MQSINTERASLMVEFFYFLRPVEEPPPFESPEIVPHNGHQNSSGRNSLKMNITCTSIKVQNGGVTRHGKGNYSVNLLSVMTVHDVISVVTHSKVECVIVQGECHID